MRKHYIPKRIIQVGGSQGITIPKDVLIANRLRLGSEIALIVDSDDNDKIIGIDVDYVRPEFGEESEFEGSGG